MTSRGSALRWEFPRLRCKNVAFRNRGDMTFEDASARWRFGTEEDISHTMAAGDLDGDGDLDVVVNRLGSPALVLRNDAAAPRVAVRLVGDAPNTKAVGAKIRLLGGAIPTQQREVVAGGLYMSHSDYEASFAMGTVGQRHARRRLARWPAHDDRAACGRTGCTRSRRRPPALRRAIDAVPPRPRCSRTRRAQLGGHTHVEDGVRRLGTPVAAAERAVAARTGRRVVRLRSRRRRGPDRRRGARRPRRRVPQRERPPRSPA